MIPIDLSQGTLPSNDLQVNNPRLRNAYITTEKTIQLLPALKLLESISPLRAIHSSTFKDRIIVATQSEVFYIQENAINKVGDIISTVFPIRMAENGQNQVTIVNGSGAWVFDQNTTGFSQLNSASNGFDITNPVDVTVLNTITVIVGGTDKEWIVSEANDAVQYGAQEVKETDESLGNLSGVEHLNNNLFILGERGMQRWVPSIERTPTSFPFTEDPTYRDEFGCISTASLVSRYNYFLYLTPNGEVRLMTDQGSRTVTNDGLQILIAELPDIKSAQGGFFYYKGDYFYSLSFTDNTFIYSVLSNRWSEYDKTIVGTTITNRIALKEGVFELSSDFTGDQYTTITIQSPVTVPKKTTPYLRTLLSSVFLDITQGKGQTKDDERAQLQLSYDNIRYGNRVSKKLSPTAKRLNQLRWYMNVANNQFSFRFTLIIKSDITIKSAWAIFQ